MRLAEDNELLITAIAAINWHILDGRRGGLSAYTPAGIALAAGIRFYGAIIINELYAAVKYRLVVLPVFSGTQYRILPIDKSN